MMLYIYLISIIIIIISYSQKRYYNFLPTLPLYPNNYNESKKVLKVINDRIYEDIKLFYETDESVVYAFKNLLPHENINNMNKIIIEKNYIIFILKWIFNRARPYQINNEISKKMLLSNSADTPAFPSGHSFQAYYLAKKLSKKYPDKKKELYKLAKKCGHARIIAGLHYPSDDKFSELLVKFMF